MAAEDNGNEVDPTPIRTLRQCVIVVKHSGHPFRTEEHEFWCDGITSYPGTTHCGNNDVHMPHGSCGGVDRSGRGLRVIDGKLNPWPQHPDVFHFGALNGYMHDARTEQFIPVEKFNYQPFTPSPSPDQEPVFGIHDDHGHSLLEFRVKNGRVEARYYPNDLDEASRRFVEYLNGMQVDGA